MSCVKEESGIGFDKCVVGAQTVPIAVAGTIGKVGRFMRNAAAPSVDGTIRYLPPILHKVARAANDTRTY